MPFATSRAVRSGTPAKSSAPFYDPEGEQLWSRAAGDVATDRGLSVSVGPGGRVLYAAQVQGDVDFGGGPIAPGMATGFVCTYD